jgi:hypothetical protein
MRGPRRGFAGPRAEIGAYPVPDWRGASTLTHRFSYRLGVALMPFAGLSHADNAILFAAQASS